MQRNGNKKQIDWRRQGFSMIEVLVASTILIMLVMLLAMLFQQTSQAWRAGVKRADGYIQIRALVGAVQRDISAAIDADTLPQLCTKGTQQFSGTSLQFYTLTGTGFEDDEDPAANEVFRTLKYITYNLATGERTETTLQNDGSWSTPKSSNVFNIAKRSGSKNTAVTSVGSADTVYPSEGTSQGLPLYIHFKVTVTTAGYALDIGAASAGPDKTWDTDDDIRTWTED